MATIQGHKNPFDPELLELNEAQLDFILEMEALDNPDKLTFTRTGHGSSVSEVKAAWDRVLLGAAKEVYYGASLTRVIKQTAAKKKLKQPNLGIVRGKKR